LALFVQLSGDVMMKTWMRVGVAAMAMGVGLGVSEAQQTTPVAFGPENPFYAPSTLPFGAPPFDKITDMDYQPAIEAGMAQRLAEMQAIAENTAPPTFENTLVAMEKSGQLYRRAMAAFNGVTQANNNPALQKVQAIEAPKQAANSDAVYLNPKLFARVKAVYEARASLDPQARRLVELTYDDFVHAGANLGDADKTKLKAINEEESKLSNAFKNKLLAGTKESAYTTTDGKALAGLSEAQLAAAASAAKARGQVGYLLPMQNTTQQPALSLLSERATREALFAKGWTRTEHGGESDTRETIARLAEVRAQKAKLLGFPDFASWKLTNQMAKTPAAALGFMDALVPAATAKAAKEASDIQAVVDSQKGGFKLQPYDWNFYAEQVRKAKYDLDESEERPYFEMNKVLEDGVFYAAHELYGISFKERHDIPVYEPEVRVYEVTEADGKPLALFYTDYFKRDNKAGGAWTSSFVSRSKLMGTLPVVYNVANLPTPADGQPALITFTDVTTMFHEFGHALHAMFQMVDYPGLGGTPRDFVEFPSQFNEHWASYPAVFAHYAKHYKTGAAMPAELAAKIKKAELFNQGYALTELLAAAELDMQWHLLPADAPKQDVDAFEAAALKKTKLDQGYVPPRYRSSYFLHIWANGYSAGYYAYLWSEMLDDAAFQWFEDNGGMTRKNGDRLRTMVLSRGNSEDLGAMYRGWLGHEPTIEPMKRQRGLIAVP
jgi:peptidyl-dipeptidase Dcp